MEAHVDRAASSEVLEGMSLVGRRIESRRGNGGNLLPRLTSLPRPGQLPLP